jgi:hypothetical protein
MPNSSWAYVAIDDGTPKETPQTLVVTPGHHEVTIRTPEGQERKVMVMVPASGGQIVLNDK